jgi:cadmium resistance protein CadD (predicted permease)
LPSSSLPNIDDLALLAGWFSDRACKTSHIVVGQLLGIGALTAISMALLPIGVGVSRLLLRRSEDGENDKAGSPAASILSVTGVTIAHGSDDIALSKLASVARSIGVMAGLDPVIHAAPLQKRIRPSKGNSEEPGR